MKSTRNIPLHKLAIDHGEAKCNISPALHHLTGADYTSKVGTKVTALNRDPEKYLKNFGTGKNGVNI